MDHFDQNPTMLQMTPNDQVRSSKIESNTSIDQSEHDPTMLYIAQNCGVKIQFDTDSYNPQFGLEYLLLNVNDFPLITEPTQEFRGWLSPMRDVTLPDDVKFAVGIPTEASRFSFLYPPRGLADIIDWKKATINDVDFRQDKSTNKWALPFVASFGGYVYFDQDYEIVGVNALTLKETTLQLDFEGPFIATSEAYEEIKDLNRYQSLYLDIFGEVGYIGLAWIDPGEHKFIDNSITGQEDIKNHHGGFLFFKHDKSASILLVDADGSLVTPRHGVGSLLRDAFRLSKDQLKLNSISTTCPSKFHDEDKIHRAAQEGSLELIQYLLTTQLLPEDQVLLRQDTFGWLPLHYACCHNSDNDELIDMLVQKCPGAICVPNNNGLYPIHLACHNNPSTKVIQLLLDRDGQHKTIQMKSKHLGFLPLHYACSNSKTSIEVIRLLILADKNHSTINMKSTLGSNSLHVAIAGNHGQEVIGLLLRSTSSSVVTESVNGLYPIHLACLKACPASLVSLLLAEDIKNEAFYQIVKRCTEYKLENTTIVHIALEYSTNDVIDLILMKEVKARCIPSYKVKNLFTVAEGIRNMYPIHIACTRKDLRKENINTLLCLDETSVTYNDIAGNTPLHTLCSNSVANHEVIRLLLSFEEKVFITKAGKARKAKSCQSAVKKFNKLKETPLSLAAKSRAIGASVLLEPNHISLKGFDSDRIEDLIELVLTRTEFQENLVENLAERQYFSLIMLEIVANILATFVYYNASSRILNGVHINFIESVILFWCIAMFVLREVLQMHGSNTFADYVRDGWNWIECSSIIALALATYHMIVLRNNEDIVPNRNLFIWSGVLLVYQFVFVLRKIFLPFARFVAGLLAIIYTLVPFFVVSVMILLAFTYSFLMSGGRVEECPSFQDCFLWTLDGFFFGLSDFTKTPIFDVLFGTLAVVIL